MSANKHPLSSEGVIISQSKTSFLGFSTGITILRVSDPPKLPGSRYTRYRLITLPTAKAGGAGPTRAGGRPGCMITCSHLITSINRKGYHHAPTTSTTRRHEHSGFFDYVLSLTKDTGWIGEPDKVLYRPLGYIVEARHVCP